MKTGPFVLRRSVVTEDEFVSGWEGLYTYANESLYDDNIRQPRTEGVVMDLFRWKNGGRLSAAHVRTIQENFLASIPEVESLDDGVEASWFLRKFDRGGAIWRIFWLHLWRPDRFPIFDQHVHRAMTWIEDGQGRELPSSDAARVRIYVSRYVPFMNRFSGLNMRRVDRALWACGKRMKALSGAPVLGQEDGAANPERGTDGG